MDTSTMKYPFGRCSLCGKEFNSELRNEYQIEHCPWCGEGIDDFLSPSAQVHPDDIYCDECGQRIYERQGNGGSWLTVEGMEKQPGVCSGPCERELCGNCGEWDDEGCCPKCHAKNPDELCAGCPKENCDELPETCKNPCPTCPGDIKCYTDNTDKRHECEKYREFLKHLPQYKDEIKTGWWKVSFELTLDGDENVRFEDLSETSQEHILQCIKDGCNQGQLVEEIDEQEEDDDTDDDDEDPLYECGTDGVLKKIN